MAKNDIGARKELTMPAGTPEQARRDVARMMTSPAFAAARNLLVKVLAGQLGIERSTFSNVLARREAPSAALAARIRAFLDSPD